MKDKPDWLKDRLREIREQYENDPERAHLDYARWRTQAFMDYHQQQLAKKGGKAPKRREWAEKAADYLARLGLSFSKAWASIPEDPHAPLELDEDTGVYRSARGETLVALDLVGGNELGEMSRSNFEKRYFRVSRRNTGQ